MKTERVFGRDLRPGDNVLTWWAPGRDMILSLQPYRGKYGSEPEFKGCRAAEFAINKAGMTIFADDIFDRVLHG